MLFWHRNKKFRECEVCNFSFNWQEGFFFLFFFPFIYLFIYFMQEHTNLFIFIQEKNIHSFYQSIQQATTCILTVPSHTKRLSFSFNIAQWLHAGLFSPATGAILLLLDRCHILLLKKNKNGLLVFDMLRPIMGEEPCWLCLQGILHIPGYDSC